MHVSIFNDVFFKEFCVNEYRFKNNIVTNKETNL